MLPPGQERQSQVYVAVPSADTRGQLPLCLCHGHLLWMWPPISLNNVLPQGRRQNSFPQPRNEGIACEKGTDREIFLYPSLWGRWHSWNPVSGKKAVWLWRQCCKHGGGCEVVSQQQQQRVFAETVSGWSLGSAPGCITSNLTVSCSQRLGEQTNFLHKSWLCKQAGVGTIVCHSLPCLGSLTTCHP